MRRIPAEMIGASWPSPSAVQRRVAQLHEGGAITAEVAIVTGVP
ncbi:hypothetical protein [Mesorhizobium sp. RMAD-H1]|nr:hypothetical protein [Mesorhizobium sp. RMAD-H1]